MTSDAEDRPLFDDGHSKTSSPVGTMPQLRRYWRIPAWLAIGAVVGFAVSYLFGVAYEANTQVLNRVNNTTFLGSNGATVTQQGTAIEQVGLAANVAQTESAMLDNREVAVAIVRKLQLDKREDDGGVIQTVKNGFATVVKAAYSFVVKGTYVQLNDFDQAVEDTQKGLSAKQVGTSYVIEVSGRWKTPEQAEAITNEAADLLVARGEDQFLGDTQANLDNLSAQLAQAGEQQQRAAGELATFAEDNGIPTANVGATLTPDLALKLSPAQQSTYRQLLQTYNTSVAAYTQLQGQYQQTQVNAGARPVQLSRLDRAVPGVYPVAPKRWLYMAIGAVIGALIGLALTARAFWSEGETLFPRDDQPGAS